MKSKYALNKKISCVIQYNLDTWPTNTFQFYCTPIDHRPSVREVWAKLDQSNEYAPDKDFSYIFAMTFKFDLETLFKVTAFTQKLWLCEVWAKLRVYMLWKQEFLRGPIWSWPTNFIQSNRAPFHYRHSVSEVWGSLDQKYMPRTRIFHIIHIILL